MTPRACRWAAPGFAGRVLSRPIGRWCAVAPVVIGVALAVSCALPARGEAVRRLCEDRLTLHVGGRDVSVPYCSSCALDEVNPAIERAVIAIHAADRSAAQIRDVIMSAARAVGAESQTIVVAPQFLEEQDSVAHGLDPEMLYWSGWMWGNESRPPSGLPANVHTSSFAVVDALLERLADRTVFPSLRTIVVTGISSGGQFVQRFAAGSRVEDTLLAKLGIHVRYVAAAPATYLYLDGKRRVGTALDAFAVPSPSTRSACPGYNDYGYGLSKPNPYMSSVGVDLIRTQYARRNIVYLIGGADNDPNDPGMDTCAAMVQGTHRLERATIFYNHLKDFSGAAIVSNHILVVVPNIGHSYELFESACGLRYLFDCDPAAAEFGGHVRCLHLAMGSDLYFTCRVR